MPTTSPISASHLITSKGVGTLTLGQDIPKAFFSDPPDWDDYWTYWDLGYFDPSGVRVIHLSRHDLVAVMAPNHRVLEVLFGPSYRTAKGPAQCLFLFRAVQRGSRPGFCGGDRPVQSGPE